MTNFRMRGYFGLALYQPKFRENYGTILRSANCFGCDFICLIGQRFQKQVTDTMSTEKHIPIYEYKTLEDFLNHIPLGVTLIGVEMDGQPIKNFVHPERAIYVVGGEDRNIPREIQTRVKINTSYCLNVAIAVSIIFYDRTIKSA